MKRDFIPASAMCRLLSLKHSFHHHSEVDYPPCPVKWVHSSDIAITLRVYSHLLPSMQEEVVEKWEDVFRQSDDESGRQGG